MINKCLISKSKKIKKIVDLGTHPFADTFISKSKLDLIEPTYPLQCYLCKESGSIQLRYLTNSDARYNMYDYSYTSSNSQYAKNHWSDYANQIIKLLKLNKFSRVAEVGSNDGFLLSKFKEKSVNVVGIDSSKFITKIARKNGIKTYQGIFDYKYSKKILLKEKKFDLLIANNVLNHSNNPLGFVKGVKNVLSKDGIFIFELPYWLDTIKSQKYDQIYHEHITYFTVKFAKNLLSMNHMTIFKVEKNNYHGGSIRVYSKVKKKGFIEPKSIKSIIKDEEKYGLFKIQTYKKFMNKIEKERNKLLQKIFQVKCSGGLIIGIGAAAKGNTFLNYHKIDNSLVSYITDASIYKINKYTPMSRIPIVSDKIFNRFKKVYALILSWNISKDLKKKLKVINKNIIFLN